MEIYEINLVNHEVAVDVLRKWKIIPLKFFYSISSNTHKKTYSYKFVARLIKSGIAYKRKLPQTTACVLVPTEKLMSDFNISINKDQFYHDVCVSYVACAFLSLEYFKECEITFEHELEKFRGGEVIPDIQLRSGPFAEKDIFHIAVEVEISRKSFLKIDEKLRRYALENRYDQIIYTFGTKTLYEVFKKRILEIEIDSPLAILKSKITLIYVKDFSDFKDDVMSSTCFSNNEEGVVNEFF
jgi:hypothetical protein